MFLFHFQWLPFLSVCFGMFLSLYFRWFLRLWLPLVAIERTQCIWESFIVLLIHKPWYVLIDAVEMKTKGVIAAEKHFWIISFKNVTLKSESATSVSSAFLCYNFVQHLSNYKLSYRLETGRQQCISLYSLVIFYRRNDLHQRPIPTSNESADLLRAQRINFSYARYMPHQNVVWGATPLSFDASFLENPCEYPHTLYSARTYMIVPKLYDSSCSMRLSVFNFTKLFSKAKKRCSGWALTRDPTALWCLFSREPARISA